MKMKLAYDFHIHTALSPCGDKDMTPNNIINMAILKGLDVIAITDHNSVENCEACMEVAKGKKIIIIPGMELQTKEEVHLLCLFHSLDKALEFQKEIDVHMTEQKNIPEIFGQQLIFNSADQVVRKNNKMLISSVNISFNEAFIQIQKLQGIVIPAHIDRNSYSFIAHLGFIPKELPIQTVEISKTCEMEKFISKYPYLQKYRFIRNSDAHHLWDIMERENFIEVREKSVDSILEVLG